MTRFLNCLLIGSLLALASCTGPRQTTISYTPSQYLQQLGDSAGSLSVQLPEPLIQKGDLLHIRVFSQSLIPETDAPYNLAEAGGSGSNGPSPTAGFLVDNAGNIEYPQIGTIHAEGMTKEELAAFIKTKLQQSEALKNPSVIVRFINYKITVLGEVKSPMSFTSPTDRITILEALGMAGDVTEFGDKSNIKIARQVNDKVEFGKIDLTKSDFFNSPYFRLRQNDVVIVEQTQRKISEEERKLRQEERQSVAQQIGIISGIITSIALILNLVK